MNKPVSKSITSSENTNAFLKRELQRKSLHLPGLLIPLVYNKWPQIMLLGFLGLSIAYMISEWLRIRDHRPLPILGNIVPRLIRADHFDLAPLYFALGLGVTSVILPMRAAFAGAVLLCLCDSVAALVGMKWGKRKILHFKKSYAGSSAFFFSAFAALLPVLGWAGSLTTAAISTLVELISQRGIDNLLLPLVGGLVAQQFLK